MEKVEEWQATSGSDFCKNCVFIDEAGFNLYTQRNHGRSGKGTPEKCIIHTGKAVAITILDVISDAGVTDVSLRNQRLFLKEEKGKWKGSGCS
jgi:hypothetical protein